MSLHLAGYVDLPANKGKGGFDHADVHAASDRLYVAHTANDALDVIDCANVGVPAIAGSFTLSVVQTVETEAGAHTFALDRKRGKVFAFLPETHRAAVYRDDA